MLALIGLVILGCSPAVTKITLNYYLPRPKDHPIRVYTSILPKCEYLEVGIVKSRQRNELISMDRVTESLRSTAREMGGDAVINVRMGDQAMGARVNDDGDFFVDHDSVLQGTVIRWKSQDCRE